MRSRQIVLGVLVMSALWIGGPTTASAGTVEARAGDSPDTCWTTTPCRYGQVVYQAAPGETNDVRIERITYPPMWGIDVLVTDRAAPLVAGRGCFAVGAHAVSCRVHLNYDGNPSGLYEPIRFVINTGDRDDRLTIMPLMQTTGIARVEVAAGEGADQIRFAQRSAYIDGGPGDDVLVRDQDTDCDEYSCWRRLKAHPCTFNWDGRYEPCFADSALMFGGPGDDRLDGGPSQTSAAVLDGGTGADEMIRGVISYAARTRGVAVSVDGVKNDGEPGERDLVLPPVAAVIGGSGADTLQGGPVPRLESWLRWEALKWQRKSHPPLHGGGGNDSITGGRGNELLVGGDGADTLNGVNGSDELHGEAGNDSLNAADESSDDVALCGEGTDRFKVDAGDRTQSCEQAF